MVFGDSQAYVCWHRCALCGISLLTCLPPYQPASHPASKLGCATQPSSATAGGAAGQEESFSVYEKKQLSENLSVDLDLIQLIIDSLSYMIQTAAYHQLSEKAITKHLLRVGFSEDHASLFATIWHNKSGNIIDTLKNSGFYKTQLQNVGWSLSLELANANGPKASPNVKMQFDISDVQGGTDAVTVAMTSEQLEDFYNKLENIQAQLDRLS
eukprot:gene11178-3236_t